MSGRVSKAPVKRGEVMPITPPVPIYNRSTAENSAQQMVGEYSQTQAPIPSGNTAELTTMRQHILAISLFPSIYRRHYNLS
jgi:hypothetical protein